MLDHKETLELLTCSAIAYQQIQPRQEGIRLVVIDDRPTDVQCYLRFYGRKLLITFRGTNSCKDWMHDFAFWKKCIPYGNTQSPIRVHTGFLNAYKSKGVRGEIHKLITDDIESVTVTGHSYGAALSVLCAVDLQYNFPDKHVQAAVFGCPRVGNKAFASSYNKRVFLTLRVENGNDIVTKVPFAFLGFRHVGIRVHCGTKRLPLVLNPLDHYPQRYYQNLLQQTC